MKEKDLSLNVGFFGVILLWANISLDEENAYAAQVTSTFEHFLIMLSAEYALIVNYIQENKNK